MQYSSREQICPGCTTAPARWSWSWDGKGEWLEAKLTPLKLKKIRYGKIFADLKSPKINARARVILHCDNAWMVLGKEAGCSFSKTLPKESLRQYTVSIFPCKLYNHYISSTVKKVTKEPLWYGFTVGSVGNPLVLFSQE